MSSFRSAFRNGFRRKPAPKIADAVLRPEKPGKPWLNPDEVIPRWGTHQIVKRKGKVVMTCNPGVFFLVLNDEEGKEHRDYFYFLAGERAKVLAKATREYKRRC